MLYRGIKCYYRGPYSVQNYLLVCVNVIENEIFLTCSIGDQTNELDFLGKHELQYLLEQR